MEKTAYGGHDPSTLVEGVIAKMLETYMVVYPAQNTGDLTTVDSITVSHKYWRGKNPPQVGQCVMLVNPMLYAAGWRASEAFPIENTRS